jgi:hypothetical protein
MSNTKVKNVTIKIENDYSDGHHSERLVDIEEPDLNDGCLDDWFMDVVYEYTGDGHGDGSFGKLGSCYTATIVVSDNPDLVGKDFEWID